MLKECRTCKWWRELVRLGDWRVHRMCSNPDAPMKGQTTAPDDCCNCHEDRPDPFEPTGDAGLE